MTAAHLLNIGVHIGAGTVAMAIGFWILASAKGDRAHLKAGRLFVFFTLAVCATAAIGNVVFRFMPLFAVLTVLVLYQLLSGWHVIYTKAAGPDRVDALLSAGAAFAAVALAPLIFVDSASKGGAGVIYSSLATLFVLIAYDLLRWAFPAHWHSALWRYEHIYKLTASLFAMLSAAAGNLFPQAQPWSQLAPSALGIACIAWFFWREARKGVTKARSALQQV